MDKPFLFNVWHQSCYSCYTFDDKSLIMKGPGSTYDKWNILVMICEHIQKISMTFTGFKCETVHKKINRFVYISFVVFVFIRSVLFL